MSPRLLVSILLVACSKPPAGPSPRPATATGSSAPAESVPREVVQLGGDRDMPNIVITAGGVYYGRQKLERVPDELARAHAALPMKQTHVFVLAAASVPAIVDTVRGVRKAGWERAALYTLDGDHKHLLCDANWEDPGPDPAESVTLSIELMRDRTWVGLSHVNEFQEIPNKGNAHDLDKLEIALKEHRASAFFYDRRDAELAFDPEITTAEALNALEATCTADFNGLRLVAPTELAARAKL